MRQQRATYVVCVLASAISRGEIAVLAYHGRSMISTSWFSLSPTRELTIGSHRAMRRSRQAGRMSVT